MSERGYFPRDWIEWAAVLVLVAIIVAQAIVLAGWAR